ncbi:unnamed protein product [Chrysoparadoxa australica]
MAKSIQEQVAKAEGEGIWGMAACVDPEMGGTHCMTSDVFFAQNQVLTDVQKALRVLNPGGTIVVHDSSPRIELAARPPPAPDAVWNGDVFRALIELRQRPDLDIAVGTLTKDALSLECSQAAQHCI